MLWQGDFKRYDKKKEIQTRSKSPGQIDRIAVRTFVTCIAGFVIFIVCLGMRRFERRVIPAVKIVVLDAEGEPVDVGADDITVVNKFYTQISAIACSKGNLWVPETFAWLRSGIGDPCYSTEIKVHPDGFHACATKVVVSTGEVVPASRVGPRLIEFHLSRSTSKDESTAVSESNWRER